MNSYHLVKEDYIEAHTEEIETPFGQISVIKTPKDYIRTKYELINTDREYAKHLLEVWQDHLEGTVIFDPCVDLGHILDAAKSLGYEVRGSDIRRVPNLEYEQKDLFDIKEDLSNYSVITAFRWATFEADQSKSMIKYVAKLGASFIGATMCPTTLSDFCPEGYEIVYNVQTNPEEAYHLLEGGYINPDRDYFTMAWKKLTISNRI